MFQKSSLPSKNINNTSPNVRINNDQLICPLHQKPIVNLFRKTNALFAHAVQLLCPFCYSVGLNKNDIRGVTPKTFPNQDGFLISFNDVPKISEDPSLKSKPSLNFFQRQLEYFILDRQSVGYSPRNLVYIEELNILAAASNNGRVTFYSMGDTVEYLTFTEIQRTIRCAKYISVSPAKKYLLLGTEKEVYVYNIKDKKPEYVTKFNHEVEVNDIEYIEEEQRMLTVGTDKNIRVWNLDSLEIDRKISADQFGIDGPLCSVIYIHEKNKLAIEHERGFCVVTLKKGLEVNDKEAPDHYLIQGRFGTGLGYLPQSHRFLLRVSKSEFAFVNGKTFEPIMTVSGLLYGEKTPGIKFISSPDGTQIVCNGNSTYFATHQGAGNAVSNSVDNYLNKTAGIQVIPDQYRLIFGDEASGRLIIYRLNRTDSSSIKNLIIGSLLSTAPVKPPVTTGFLTNPIPPPKSSWSFGTNQSSSLTSSKPLPTPKTNVGSRGSTPQKSEPKALRKRDDSRKIKRTKTEIVIKSKKSASKKKRQKSKDDERERSASSKKKDVKSPKKEKKERKVSKSPKKERSESKESKSSKKEKKTPGLIELFREHKNKSKKDEKVWVVFDEEEKENKSTKSKKPSTPTRGRKQDRKASVSEERSRSRTKSKSTTVRK